MKSLNDLEKEFFKEIHGREVRMDGTEDTYLIDEAKEAAALCEKKIRRAIALASEGQCFTNEWNEIEFERKYSDQEILDIISSPSKEKL